MRKAARDSPRGSDTGNADDTVKAVNIREIRELLGKRLFGPAEWLRYYPDALRGRNLAALPPFPWEKSVLEAACPFSRGLQVRDTHFAFLGLPSWGNQPLTLFRLHSLLPGTFHPDSLHHYGRCRKEDWAVRHTCDFRWYLMPLANLSLYDGMQYHEQLDMLPARYEVPQVVEGVSKLILHGRVMGSYPEMRPGYSWFRDAYGPFPECRIALRATSKGLLRMIHIPDRCRGDIVISASVKLPNRDN